MKRSGAVGSGREQPIPTVPTAAPIGPTVRKTVQDTRLQPTPPQAQQERAVEAVRWRGRSLDTCVLEQRITWWRRGQGRRGKRATRFQPDAQRTHLRAAFPADAARHRPVLQEGLARLDRTSEACLRRVQAVLKPGFPRCKPATRSHRFTDQQVGNGAPLTTAAWSSPRSGG